jgi:acyl carrier protein
MDEQAARLHRCFAAVFPSLAENEIIAASVDTVPEWDSLASLTLFAVVEDAFEVQISELDFSELRSYAALHEYLQRPLESAS